MFKTVNPSNLKMFEAIYIARESPQKVYEHLKHLNLIPTRLVAHVSYTFIILLFLCKNNTISFVVPDHIPHLVRSFGTWGTKTTLTMRGRSHLPKNWKDLSKRLVYFRLEAC